MNCRGALCRDSRACASSGAAPTGLPAGVLLSENWADASLRSHALSYILTKQLTQHSHYSVTNNFVSSKMKPENAPPWYHWIVFMLHKNSRVFPLLHGGLGYFKNFKFGSRER